MQDDVSKGARARCVLCGCDTCQVVFEAGKAQPNRVLKCDSCGLMYLEDPEGLRHRERSIRTDTHILYFTPDTLTIERVLYNVGVMSGSQRIQRAIRAMANRLGLGKPHFRLNIHDMVRVYAVKAE